MCVASQWVNLHYMHKDPVFCPDCKNTIRSARKDWPIGPEHRSPIVAGPMEPATTGVQGKIYLVACGISAEEAKLDAVAKSITMSTGLEVKILPDKPLPDMQGEKGWYLYDDLLSQVYQLVKEEQEDTPAALCVVTDANMQWINTTL